LYYMRARYYDPVIGRFISEDPIGFEGGDVNLYAYVGNNPMNFVDPEGLEKSDSGYEIPTILFDKPWAGGGAKGKETEVKGGHNTGERPSTEEKHQKGDKRRRLDQGGEKKDPRNTWPPKKKAGGGPSI